MHCVRLVGVNQNHIRIFSSCVFSVNLVLWKLPRYMKKLLVAALAYTVYIIWCTRNEAIWLGYVQSPQQAMHKVKTEVALRIQRLNSKDTLAITMC
jgi:predicted DNA-binding transcriptional regulator